MTIAKTINKRIDVGIIDTNFGPAGKQPGSAILEERLRMMGLNPIVYGAWEHLPEILPRRIIITGVFPSEYTKKGFTIAGLDQALKANTGIPDFATREEVKLFVQNILRVTHDPNAIARGYHCRGFQTVGHLKYGTRYARLDTIKEGEHPTGWSANTYAKEMPSADHFHTEHLVAGTGKGIHQIAFAEEKGKVLNAFESLDGKETGTQFHPETSKDIEGAIKLHRRILKC